MEIKAIGFDYGGVIAGWPSSKFDLELCSILEITVQEFQSTYFEINHLLNKKELPRNDFFKLLLEKLHRSIHYDEVIKFLDSIPTHEINKDVLDLIKRLRIEGYKIGILSNNTIEMATRFRESGLVNYFDAFVVSAEIGFMKPQIEAFQIFFKELGVSPSETVFIDDTFNSLIGAEQIGFQPILFTNYDDLILQLRKLGIKWV